MWDENGFRIDLVVRTFSFLNAFASQGWTLDDLKEKSVRSIVNYASPGRLSFLQSVVAI